MPDRRASSRDRPRRSRRTTRVRLLLIAAGTVGFSLLGISGTLAYFTDSPTAVTGTNRSGTVDVTLAGNLSGSANNGATWTNASLTATALLPGESVAHSFAVANAGTGALTYSVTATGSGDTAVTDGIEYSVAFGVAASNSGTVAAANRAGACGGVASTDANTTPVRAAGTSFATNRALVVGASETVCVVARLASNAPGIPDKSGSAMFQFAAKQTGAP